MNLFARIGLKADQQKAEQFQRSVKGIRTGLIAATAAATAYGAAVQKLMRDSMQAANEFRQFTAETGASAEELQRWTSVADQVSGAGKSVASSIRAITENQAAIRLGQGDVSGYQLLGIDPRQDPFEILEQLRDRIGNLAPAMQGQVLSQIGLSRDMLQVLQMSREEFSAMASAAPVMSSEQIQTINAARESAQQLGQTFTWLKNTIAAELAPGFMELSTQLQEFMVANDGAIIKGVQKGLDILLGFGEALMNVVKITNRAISGTIGWENAIKGLAVALAWFNRALLFSPIGMFMAAIVALILVMDDLSAYFNEDDPRRSAFGDLMGRFPEMEERIMGFVERFRGLGDVLKDIFTNDPEVEGAAQAWSDWASAIERVVDALRNFLTLTFNREARVEAATSAADRIQEEREGFSFQQGIDNMRQGLENIGDMFRGESRFRDLIDMDPDTPGVQLRRPNEMPLQGRVNSIDSRTINISVNGGDPLEVRRVIRQELSLTGAQIGAG